MGENGKTVFEKIRGKRHRGEMLPFWCNVLYRVAGKVKGGNMQPRRVPGNWLGKRWSTDEHVVANEDGQVMKTRCVRRLTEESSWSAEGLDKVVGWPWDPAGNAFAVGGIEGRFALPEVPPAEPHEPVPRRLKIQQRHLERVGPTVVAMPPLIKARHL